MDVVPTVAFPQIARHVRGLPFMIIFLFFPETKGRSLESIRTAVCADRLVGLPESICPSLRVLIGLHQ